MLKKTAAALILIILAAVFIMPSCHREEKSAGYPEDMGDINVKKTDEIIITSGSDGGTGVITDKEIIKELAEAAEGLSFELDMDAAMTMGEMYTLKFMEKDKIAHQLSFDKKGIFWYEDTPGCYTLSGGEMDYDYIDTLFHENYVEDETEKME